MPPWAARRPEAFSPEPSAAAMVFRLVQTKAGNEWSDEVRARMSCTI
jgi:hypothetical protein